MSTILTEKLTEFLEKASDWDEKSTTMPGVTIVKVAKSRKTHSRLMVKLNVVDDGGRPLKKRGLTIKSLDELEGFLTLLKDGRVKNLVEAIQHLNRPKNAVSTTGEPALQI